MSILRIAQFNKLALYFPLYLAIRKGFLKGFGIDNVQLMNTLGDAETFVALMKNNADIDLSDPIFAISEDHSQKEKF